MTRVRSCAIVWSLAALAVACGGTTPKGAFGSAPSPAPSTALVGASPQRAGGVLTAPSSAESSAFVDEVEARLHQLWAMRDRASWVNENFITDDTEALAASAEEATAGYVGEAIQRSKRYAAIRDTLPADVARKLYLLSVAQTVPAPRDPRERSEIAAIETWMTGTYGKGQYCPPAQSTLGAYVKKADSPCLRLDDLARVLKNSRKPDELAEAWRGWHAIAAPMKDKYARYVSLANKGAVEIGFADVGALWRAGYDMPPDAFEADIERLWAQVKPLYDELHCLVRGKLKLKYGSDVVPDRGPIPAHLFGNMWAQEWNNIYDLVVPYPLEPSIDVGQKLGSGRYDAVKMVREGEHFFTSLGFAPLPHTFWERSLFVRPRDREVVCHASAWDVTWSGDLRIKMCIEPTEQDFVTIHHELGHDFYFQRYGGLPVLFQQGANDGFHEAIGDTMALSVTPAYLESIGLLQRASAKATAGEGGGERARMNQQMKMALDKVAFLPFGLLIDKWRWQVFSGKVGPSEYNTAWWKLKESYQGVAPPSTRGADDFDPGAKFHVASSTPYIRYFLARIYQFQFHKALCDAAGYKGPLDLCSIHDNHAAGAKLMAMLSLGASKPWPDAMEVIGAGRQADSRPMLEYFAPLARWLAEQNAERRRRGQCTP